MLTAAGMCLALSVRCEVGFLWSLLFLPFVDLAAVAYMVTQ